MNIFTKEIDIKISIFFRLKMNSNDDDLEIIDLDDDLQPSKCKTSLVTRENSFEEVLILSDDERQQPPPVLSATLIPKKEKLKVEDVVIDWSIFKNTTEPKLMPSQVKVEPVATDGNLNDFFQQNLRSSEGMFSEKPLNVSFFLLKKIFFQDQFLLPLSLE